MSPAGTRTPNGVVQILTRRIILGLLLAWAAGSWLVSASFLWTPRGTVGLRSNYGGEISSVAPGSPADRAGIVAGDRIVLDRTPFESRPKLVGTTTPIAAGTVVPFFVQASTQSMQHGTQSRGNTQGRYVSLTAVAESTDPGERFSLLMDLASTAIFIIVGLSLIMLRPSLVTWGFGLFCLLTNPIVPALSRFPSASAHLWYVLIYDVIQNVGIVGLLVFALNFPNALQYRWRIVLTRMLGPIFVLLAAWTLAIDLAVCVLAWPVRSANIALQFVFAIVDIVAIVLITETYVRGPAANRPRLRWVLVGFYIGLLCNFIGNLFIYTSNAVLPGWVDNVLVAIAVMLPLTVAYAVVRHRVIDVDFFFSRALIYAVFTSALVTVFGLSDWLFTRVLSDFRLSILLDALVSIGVALTFDRVQRFLERSLDAVVFRDRQIGADRLQRTAQALRFLNTASAIDDRLVCEPHEALNIEATALFRKDGMKGTKRTGYHRVVSVGWDEGDCKKLSADDRLIAEHLAREGVLHLADIPWQRSDTPGGGERPVLSVPVRSDNTLEAVLLCSLKPHGEQLDPEELGWLLEFAVAAAIAYARLDTEQLRKHTQTLEVEVAVLNGRLEEARKL